MSFQIQFFLFLSLLVYSNQNISILSLIKNWEVVYQEQSPGLTALFKSTNQQIICESCNLVLFNNIEIECPSDSLVLLIENQENYENFIRKNNQSYCGYFNTIILNAEVKFTADKNKFFINIFQVNSNIFAKITQILENERHIKMKIISVEKYSFEGTQFLFASNFIIAIGYSLIIIFWGYYLFREAHSNYLKPIHKMLRVFPLFKLIYTLMNLFAVNTILMGDISETRKDILFFEVFIKSFQNIYFIIFWMMMILISNGYQISKENFSQNEKKMCVLVFFAVFLVYTFELGADSEINSISISHHTLSLISIILYLNMVFTYYVRKCTRSLLNMAYIFNQFSRSQAEIFLNKIQLLRNHLSILRIYSLLKLFGIIFSTLYLSVQDNFLFTSELLTHFIDFIFWCFYLWNIRPRKGYFENSFFSTNLTDEEETFNYNFWKCSLPASNEIYNSTSYNQVINLESKDKQESEFSILVQPFFPEEKEIHIIDKISIIMQEK